MAINKDREPVSDEQTLRQERERKQESLEETLCLLNRVLSTAEEADIQLDVADALEGLAEELRTTYSTVKYRHVGPPGGVAGRVQEKG